MSEVSSPVKVHTLSELTGSISRAINNYYNKIFWIKAEISKLNFFPKSGHCYPELVEISNGGQVAVVDGFINKSVYNTINGKFLQTIGDPLKDGMEVILKCKPYFSSTRGLKLTILDIDIESVIGAQTLKNIDCINRLKSEGVFLQNKRHTLPRLIKNLAIISTVSGKGYADFMSLISKSDTVAINTTLLAADMIGEKAVSDIIANLNALKERLNEFDAVCIIRGGGGDNTLQCFNNYELAKTVATFPMPVFSGIGHATNQTAVEQVSNLSFVSPSELANYLINKNKHEAEELKSVINKISQLLVARTQSLSQKLGNTSSGLKNHFQYAIKEKNNMLVSIFSKIENNEKQLFFSKSNKISVLHNKIASRFNSLFASKNAQLISLDSSIIQKVTKKGRIFLEDKPVSTVEKLKVGDTIKFFTDDGIVLAEVKEVIKSNNN